MKPIRVLIVDDSALIRKILIEVLEGDVEISVCGVATNGQMALEKLQTHHPDVVILDVEMPVMDGITALKEIRKQDRKIPVIMFSSLTKRGAGATLDALAAGATDYVAKPANMSNLSEAMQRIQRELVGRIKTFFPKKPESFLQKNFSQKEAKPPEKKSATQRINRKKHSVDIVVIGVSTGGPNALAEVLPRLPKDFPIPVIVVQHMPPVFTQLLAKRLSEATQIPVCEAENNALVTPGTIWLAPGDYHLVVEKKGLEYRFQTNQDPPENFCRPAVDVLFRSVLKAYGPNVLAVILTGMGSDGLASCQKIYEAGGEIIAQDQQSSVVWGMPGHVVKAGYVDAVLSLSEIGSAIVKRVSKVFV